jgi:hypothetical protein
LKNIFSVSEPVRLSGEINDLAVAGDTVKESLLRERCAEDLQPTVLRLFYSVDTVVFFVASAV